MIRPASIAVFGLLVAAVAPPSGAQSIRGRVTDAATSGSLPEAVVLLLDSSRAVVARAMTSADGSYTLRVPRPGIYRVQTLRLGFKPFVSSPVTVAAGDLTLDLAPAGIPVRLDRLQTVARTECQDIGADTSSAAYTMLEQVRMALHATALTARRTAANALDATIVEYERDVDPANESIRQQTTLLTRGWTLTPWASLPPASIHTAGYVARDLQGYTTYHAPDIAVLLSSEFVDDHCFRAVVGSTAADSSIRLEFEPVRSRRRIPEIKGRLVLDRASAQLRRLDFEYVNLETQLRGDDARPGGYLAFDRPRSNVWLVSRWFIKMPLVGTRRVSVGSIGRVQQYEQQPYLAGARVKGGELVLLVRRGDTLVARADVEVSGAIVDSASGRGVRGARVSLRGTQLTTESDSTGRFHFGSLLPGTYGLEISTRALQAFASVLTRPLTVTSSDSTVVVRLPSSSQLLTRSCATATQGALVGLVTGADSLTTVRGVRVQATWDSSGTEVGREARPDLHGVYRLCGVPLDAPIRLRAIGLAAASTLRSIVVGPDTRVGILDLALDRTIVAGATITGTVLDAANARPVANAIVRLGASDRATVTDVLGRYSLRGVASGVDTISVRRLGFKPVEIVIAAKSNESIARDIVLERVATLDTVAVVATSLPPSFEEHRRIGLGQFLGRDRLARNEGRFLSEVLKESFRGLDIFRALGGQAAVISTRGTQSMASGRCFRVEGANQTICKCAPLVYLDRLLLFNGRSGELPNINRLPIVSIEAIEFFAGPAETPLEYSTLNSTCGVLVIHTRR
ncbi:MAG TPA: carboxypeptidase regulatory-like domain-containing protein [Gemmatimonadaceae bacterium]|nr:carboxypeptidase regulatory-like domain-containing protein [Gemmatimonadaceae bacterium]